MQELSKGGYWLGLAAGLVVLHDFSADEPSSDFVGSSADAVQFSISQNAADRIVVGIAVTTQSLDSFQSNLNRSLSGMSKH